LLSALALAAVVTLVGVLQLWPSGSAAPKMSSSAAFGAPGVTFPRARVLAVQPPCPVTTPPAGTNAPDTGYTLSRTCGNITVRIAGTSRQVTVQVPPEVSHSGLQAGDQVQLVRAPPGQGQPASYTYFTTDRRGSLFWFAAVLVTVVIAVARWRGLMALVTLGVGAWTITQFVLPALMAGESGLLVALAGSSAIMFVVLYATHGLSLRTSAALAGTLVGVALTGAAGDYAVHASRLTGISDETGGTLAAFIPGLNFPGLLTCGLIVAGLGVLNDVTITQASAVWELRAVAPQMPRRQVFSSAMRIGRDHIASTIYTIVFAYAGASLVVLLLLNIYDRPMLQLISNEAIAEEIVRTLASAFGLVLAMPITTAIAVAVASPRSATQHRGWDDSEDVRDPFQQFWNPSQS
jgi:uncharacterized membrane protein